MVRDLRNARNPQGGSANGIPLKAKTPDAGSKKPVTGPFAVVTVASWVVVVVVSCCVPAKAKPVLRQCAKNSTPRVTAEFSEDIGLLYNF